MKTKIKTVLKTIWISGLSTITKLLAQTLRADGFKDINTIRMAFIEVPIEYLLINFFIFVALTILFIFINEQIPTYKLIKGVVYGLIVTVFWTALRFQPNIFENFMQNLIDIIVFSIPMIIYGVFLGYLASDKTTTFKFSKKQISSLIISLGWLLIHLIYMIFVPPAKGQTFNYIIWLLTASIIIGIIFGFFYQLSLKCKYNTLLINALIVMVMFSSYYAYRFSIVNKFDLMLFIRVLLDIISVLLSIQFIELYLGRPKNSKT